jgi:Zn-dependent protease with chaperone function
MILAMAAHFIVLSTGLAALTFVLACGVRALARQRLALHPYTLANLYAIALTVPPCGAAWLVAAAFLPTWWLSEPAFEVAHEWPLHSLHLLAGVLGETEQPFALVSAALLAFLAAALIVASVRGRMAVRRALEVLPNASGAPTSETAVALREATTREIRQRLGIHVITADYPVAFIWGLRRTRLVLSSGFIALLDRDRLRAVIAHERAHHDRRDNLWRLVLLVCAYSSLAMPLSRRVLTWYGEQVEVICDEVAACVTRAPLDLAAALVSIRRSTLSRPSLMPMAMAGISAVAPREAASFEHRVRRLIDLAGTCLHERRTLRRGLWPLARAGLLLLTVTLAAVTVCAPLAVHHAIEACLQLLG